MKGKAFHLFSLLIACLGLKPLPSQAISPNADCQTQQTLPQLSEAQVGQIARWITVKVFSDESWGSGILLHQQAKSYTVLTNNHVLTGGNGQHYRIQTPDNRIYAATVSDFKQFAGNDLALLQFSSERQYAMASVAPADPLCPGEKTFAAGFPFGGNGLVFTTGQISLFLAQAFQGGYQIGYTNDIRKGMSGGPVLNQQGQLLGINGQHAYPLWGNPYVFTDGSTPSESLRQQMVPLSWAIPIEKLFQLWRGETKPPQLLNHLPVLVSGTRPQVANPVPVKSQPGWLW